MARPWLRVAGLLFLAVASLFLGASLAGGWSELLQLRQGARDYPWQLAPAWLIAGVALGAGALLATGAAWTRLVRSAGQPIPYSEGAVAWLGSNLGRYIPGKIWQLSGLAAYAKGRGHSGAAALSTTIALQAVTLLTGAAIGLGLVGAPLLGAAGAAAWGWLVVPLLLVPCAHPAVIRRVARFAARLLREERATPDPGGRDLLIAGATMVGVWLAHGLGFWCVLRGIMGATAPGVGVATGIFAASYVAGYIVLIAPGGLLVREGAMAGLLTAMMVLPGAVAAAVSVVARIWTTLSEIVAFLLGIAVARLFRRAT